MIVDALTERLPQIRCTPEMKQALMSIARQSVSRNLADHMRFAVERYIEAHRELAEAPVVADEDDVVVGK